MYKEIKQINVAIAGCGTVGGGVASILKENQAGLLERNPVKINLKYIVDINFSHALNLGLDENLFCKDYNKVLEDKEVTIVIELIGGLTIAKDMIEKALNAGKSVITANKALLAMHGPALMELARKKGVSIAFEASCAGGIPVIRAITDGLIANQIHAIYGIVNGTSNYILTAMTQRSISYSDALAEAQADGLAEADPTLDVSGIDSAHKLTILSSLSFGKKIDFKKISVEGINNLSISDVGYGEQLGYTIKLLAIAQRRKEGLVLCVRPAFIAKEHPLAWVSGPFNAVSIYGDSVGHTMYYGRGAGDYPTASAVIADIIQTGLGITKQMFDTLSLWPDISEPAVQLAVENMKSRFYIRITAEEKPGVLAKIAQVFGKQNISISSVLQKEIPDDNPGLQGIPVIITTYPAIEGNIRSALSEIDNMDVIKAGSICIQIVDEHPEYAVEE